MIWHVCKGRRCVTFIFVPEQISWHNYRQYHNIYVGFLHSTVLSHSYFKYNLSGFKLSLARIWKLFSVSLVENTDILLKSTWLSNLYFSRRQRFLSEYIYNVSGITVDNMIIYSVTFDILSRGFIGIDSSGNLCYFLFCHFLIGIIFQHKIAAWLEAKKEIGGQLCNVVQTHEDCVPFPTDSQYLPRPRFFVPWPDKGRLPLKR